MRSAADPADTTRGVATRMVALDGWRGICAIMVVLFHFLANSHLFGVPLVRNAYLFVDFFFVLSGFVITANYEDRLREGFGLGQFMLLRVGRLLPLHLFVLGLFVLAEATGFTTTAWTPDAPAPFEAEGRSASSLVRNALLLQGLGLHSDLTWNGPSWSISVEFWTYLVFAAVVIALRPRFALAVILVALGLCPWILAEAKGHLSATYNFGWTRCLFGFAGGALCVQLHRWPERSMSRVADRVRRAFANRWSATALELAVALAALAFVADAGYRTRSALAPFAFMAVVVTFARDAGLVSRALALRPIVLLGTLSYSMYMLHTFVQMQMQCAAHWLEARHGWAVFDGRPPGNVPEACFYGTTAWQGDVAYGLMVFLVIAASAATNRWIEQPGRRAFRRLGR